MHSSPNHDTSPIGISPFNRLYCNGQLKPRYLYLRKPTSKRKSQRTSTNIICHISDEEVHACLACLMSAQPNLPHASSIIANGMTAADFCTRLITSHWRPILLSDQQPQTSLLLQSSNAMVRGVGQDVCTKSSKRGNKRNARGDLHCDSTTSNPHMPIHVDSPVLPHSIHTTQ